MPRRRKAVLDATDELCQLWSYAEDLETFEYSNKVLLEQNAGPVSLLPLFWFFG